MGAGSVRKNSKTEEEAASSKQQEEKARRRKARLQEIGNRLRYYRERENLTQEGLAELVGVEPNTIYRYENGQTEMGSFIMFDICKHLNIPMEYLMEEPQHDDTIDLFEQLFPEEREPFRPFIEMTIRNRMNIKAS